MKFLNKKTNIDFVGQRKIAFIVSISLVLLSIVMLAVRGA